MKEALISIGKKEIEDIINTDEEAEIVCHFCNKKYKFDKMFVGSYWKGTKQWNEFEKQFSKYNVEIVYLPHTDGISSTKLTSVIKEILDEKPEEK